MPKKLTKADIERRIEQINDARQDALEALAEEVREQYVVPACKKSGKHFLSGNGSFMFCGERQDRNDTIMDVDDAIIDRKRYLIPVIDILDIEVSHGDHLGFYVRNVQ